MSLLASLLSKRLPSVSTTHNYQHLRFFGILTALNATISPYFLVWKFCGKAQFPHQKIRRNCGILRSISKIDIGNIQEHPRYFSGKVKKENLHLGFCKDFP